MRLGEDNVGQVRSRRAGCESLYDRRLGGEALFSVLIVLLPKNMYAPQAMWTNNNSEPSFDLQYTETVAPATQ